MRRLVISVLFGINLVLGYLAMLVAMTYSVELFTCVVLGICCGHFIFNTKTAVGESIDPCCASQQHCATSKAVIKVPLTRTPCDLEGQEDSDSEEEEEGQKQPNGGAICCSSKQDQNGISNGSIHHD